MNNFISEPDPTLVLVEKPDHTTSYLLSMFYRYYVALHCAIFVEWNLEQSTKVPLQTRNATKDKTIALETVGYK